MEPSAADIAERLQQGTDLASVLFSLLPDSHRLALSRCAALRSFDRATYQDLLRLPGGPDLDELLAADEAEPVRSNPHRYRVVGSLRKVAFLEWWLAEGRVPLEPPVPPVLRELARAAAERSLTAGRAVDALDLLLLGDPPAARTMFQSLFGEADKAHDLPACAALLEVLEAPTRLTLLDTELLALYRDRRSYLAARTMWQAEYNESERYLQRPSLEHALEQTLDGRDARVMQLLGRGGMGKTMQLRWLISRRCVLADSRIPCARIDFDSVLLTVATRAPWLLLTEISAQLDRQFGNAPFQDLLANYGDYRVLLRRSSDAPSSVEVPVRADDLDGEDLLTRFTQTLIDSAGDRQVVLVFDTVEELLLRPGSEPTALVHMLRRVHDEVPQVRLVFASRQDLFEKLGTPSGREHAPEQSHPSSRLLPRLNVRVDQFGDEERLRYLREIRGLPDGELVRAIARQSGGTPFTLAVFADLVREDPSLTAADVERLRDPGLRYVIDRVVSRIDDKRIRWLLRFGVIPSTLTYGFVAEVLKPFLARALTDTSRKQSSNPAEQETWEPGGTTPPETEAELRQLWESLLTYAGSYSWLWVEGEASDTIRFHPEVLEPLRGVLRDTDPDFRPLNRAAAAYYEKLAGRLPAEWPSLMRQAVFHHFQADVATGIRSWRAALAEARRLGRLDWARAVAEEVREGHWLEGDAGVTNQALAEAYLELARTAADLARIETGEQSKSLWCEAEEDLGAADALAGARHDITLPEPTTKVLRAHISVRQGHPDKAVALLHSLPGPPLPTAEMAELDNTLGEAFEALGRPQAADYYRAALDACEHAGDKIGARRALLHLARQSVEGGRADDALRWLEHGRRWLSGEKAAVMEAQALGRSGVPLQAARQLYERGAMSADAAALRARLLYDGGQPEQATAAASEALQVLAGSTGASDDTAKILAVRGLAHAALLEFGLAVDDLLAAGDRARRRRELDAVAMYAALRSIIRLQDMGDVRAATQAAEEALRAQGEPGGEGWTLAQLAYAQVLDRLGSPREAWQVMDTVLDGLRAAPDSLHSRLRTAITGLTLTPVTDHHMGDDGSCLAFLAGRLRGISPAAARFQLLHRLANATAQVEADPAVREELVQLARAPLDSSPAPPPNVAERAAFRLAAAEVLRVANSRAEARDMLDRVTLDEPDEMTWWGWVRAQERLGPATPAQRRPPEWLSLCDRHPALGAAYLITLAGYRKNLDPPDQTKKRLDKAEHLLQRVVTSQRWDARLHELRAEVADDTGHRDSAQRSAVDAARIWGELGDDRRQVSIGASYKLGQHAAEPDTAIMELRISRMALPGTGVEDSTRIEVTARLPGGDEVSQVLPGDEIGDRPEGGRISLRSVVGRLRKDPDAWALTLARALPTAGRALIIDQAPAGPLDVRLICDTREAASLPWELAQADESSRTPLARLPRVSTVYRAPPADIRAENHTVALQEILRIVGLFGGQPDSFMGEHTRSALLAFQRRAGLPANGRPDRQTWQALRHAMAERRRAAQVVVIRPGRYRELVRRRGTTASGGDLVQLYQSHGMPVTVIEDPTPELLRLHAPWFRDAQPDIIHLAGAVMLESGATVLDFGGDAATRSLVKGSPGGDQIPVTALGDLVAASARPSLGPTVILDVSWPGSKSEALRALFVRNSFAHQLARLGRVVAVIGTGLAPPSDQAQLYQLLIGGFGEGGDAASVVRDIRRGAPGHTSPWADLPFSSTALFLQRAPHTLLPPGTS
jgi:tetratricopeptide (TPR) repeat protein